MARRRRIAKKFQPIRRVGWYYPGGRKGLFCPDCGSGLYLKGGIHPQLICYECGWAEREQTAQFLENRR